MSETSDVKLQTEEPSDKPQEFPKWKYKGADSVLVYSKAEEDKLDGYVDTPNESTNNVVDPQIAALRVEVETLKRMNAELASQIVDLNAGKRGRKNVADTPTVEPVLNPETGTASL